MLKKARYPNRSSFGPKFLKVVYVIKGRECYFTGVQREGTSTTNAAEEIMTAIAEQEHVPVGALEYFDIKTFSSSCRLPGEYDVDRLVIEMIPRSPRSKIPFGVVAWKPTGLPDDIALLFREYIGVDLRCKYAQVHWECQGLYGVTDKDGKSLYVDKSGTPVTDRYVDMTRYNNKGFAWISKGNDRWAQIDRQGNQVSEWIDGDRLF